MKGELELERMSVSLVVLEVLEVLVVLEGVPTVLLVWREAAGRLLSPHHQHSVVVLVSDIPQSSHSHSHSQTKTKLSF